MIAGIYVRTSSVRQGEEGTSLVTQEEQSKLKATELGYQVDPAYIWRDMESGAYIDRAGVKRMLEAVKNQGNRVLWIILNSYKMIAISMELRRGSDG